MRLFDKVLVIVATAFFTAILVYSVLNIFQWKNDVYDNYDTKQETSEFVTTEDGLKVDFMALKEKNSDTVGYLKVNGTNINYVVVQADDNDFYLSHNFNREANVAGWVFADYRNLVDGTDKNLIIYGHNIKEGSMFGSLINVVDESWQSDENNLIVTFLTEGGEYSYKVFSTYLTSPEDYYIQTKFDDESFGDFIQNLIRRSNHDYGIEVDKNDQILTLSSCVGNGEQRVVLHAKLL